MTGQHSVGMTERPARGYLVTTRDAARLAGVSVDCIHQWSSRGFLTRHGGPRMALWDWRELGRVAATPGQRQQAV